MRIYYLKLQSYCIKVEICDGSGKLGKSMD
ncbi:MAG TPA: hypothetical protein DHV46_09620 [Desulfovibrio piger]|uniref:Uncharacterized protein n=1 Tax=Nitratidesulfovibrio vulgaris (strain ATCC 29579 / DSM 644 / CCUG 34227 / NCIMB 8303 / VKM B-1760 / Hildenborough) TaxID=882 RepID=Q72AJ2_NITV2|nr:hypothetical protein DVU_2000 [Nitratidesulfovibrio vulgaris str. Hildenborough]NHZ45544.1 hypothetical protein [Nitratidesulfovibrio liaohensis]HCZ44770.1 hypothetical protein [Desulfovibrio piger]